MNHASLMQSMNALQELLHIVLNVWQRDPIVNVLFLEALCDAQQVILTVVQYQVNLLGVAEIAGVTCTGTRNVCKADLRALDRTICSSARTAYNVSQANDVRVPNCKKQHDLPQ